jgi:hypothetical protein
MIRVTSLVQLLRQSKFGKTDENYKTPVTAADTLTSNRTLTNPHRLQAKSNRKADLLAENSQNTLFLPTTKTQSTFFRCDSVLTMPRDFFLY